MTIAFTRHWAAVAGFAILMLLGLGIPFWMEYKSLTNPSYLRPRNSAGRAEIDPGTAYYCPDCGAQLTLPAWSDASPRPDVQVAARVLTSSTAPSSELSRARRSRATMSGEAQ